MPELSTRRLAAIMFTDIAGYTALMQRDEQDALQKLARFKQALESKTAEFRQILRRVLAEKAQLLETAGEKGKQVTAIACLSA